MASSQISGLPASSPAGPSEVPPPTAAAHTSVAANGPSELDDAVSVDITDGSPPPEVLAAVAEAGAAYDELAAQGLHVSVDRDADSGQLNLELQDHDGTVLSQLKPSEVLALADGNAPDQTRKSTDVHQQRQPDQ